MKRSSGVAAFALALLLTGCTADNEPKQADPYATALANCLAAYAKAPKWTEDLGGPSGACSNWEESQGRADFTRYWNDPDEWGPYMESVYEFESL